MKEVLKSVFVIVGAVVGAGFASGQEIYSFFNIYNENGLIGIIISSILLGIIIYKVLKKSNESKLKSYDELLEKIKVPSTIKNIFVTVFWKSIAFIRIICYHIGNKDALRRENICLNLSVIISVLL